MVEDSILTVEMEEFLEDLRESGRTNMAGAAPYLEEEFGMSRENARAALQEWMSE